MHKKKAGFHQCVYSYSVQLCTVVHTCAAGITQPLPYNKWPNKVIVFQKCTFVVVWTRETILMSNVGLLMHLPCLSSVDLNNNVKGSEVIPVMN